MSADRAEKPVRQVPLDALHRQAGAKMVPFAGWEMPVSYSGINAEHQAVRDRVGLFDVSHMGQITVEGPQAGVFLERLLPRKVSAMPLGRMVYAPMCAADGGTLDDLLVYRSGPEQFMLVVNAAREAVDWAWIQAQAAAFEVSCHRVSDDWAMVAIQGPQSKAVLAEMGVSLPPLRYYAFCQTAEGEWIGRSGYTGERGYEILCPSGRAAHWWTGLVAAGAQPCGLGARDTLRTEAGFCLYGHELDESISPIQAGLAWAVDFSNSDFIGRPVLESHVQDPKLARLVGIKMLDKGIPRPAYALARAGGEGVGRLTSGTFSPSLATGIGLGLINPEFSTVGTEIGVDMRGTFRRAQVVALPFVPLNVRGQNKKKKGMG